MTHDVLHLHSAALSPTHPPPHPPTPISTGARSSLRLRFKPPPLHLFINRLSHTINYKPWTTHHESQPISPKAINSKPQTLNSQTANHQPHCFAPRINPRLQPHHTLSSAHAQAVHNHHGRHGLAQYNHRSLHVKLPEEKPRQHVSGALAGGVA